MKQVVAMRARRTDGELTVSTGGLARLDRFSLLKMACLAVDSGRQVAEFEQSDRSNRTGDRPALLCDKLPVT